MLGVLLCFLLSGFAALLYQTAWLRQLSLVFGTSELAVATVLAAYMAGLAIGAAVAGRWVGRVRRPILVYGLLELGIALSALAVPTLMALASSLYVAALGGQPAPPPAGSLGQPLFYLVVSTLILAIPTSLMGATLPLLTQYAVHSDRELGARVSTLYATNTGGAVLGTLCTGFLLLPRLGIHRTVLVGVAANALVFIIAAWLGRAQRAEQMRDATERTQVSPALHWILPVMLASGLTSFTYEVVWTRLLTHVLGGGIHAFATMLATFLTGITLGAALAGRFAKNRETAAAAFVVAQLGIALLSMAVYGWMGPLLPRGEDFFHHILFAMAVMLPATLFIGATFPLAVRILARNEQEAGRGIARVYTWNTVGGILGATLAGFWLLPALGFAGIVKLAVCLNAALALVALLASAPTRRLGACALGAGLLSLLAFYQPTRPAAVDLPVEILRQSRGEVRETFYAVGRSATVLVVDDGESHGILSNGLTEAAIASRGAPPAQDPQVWLTALAVAARPEARSLLVVGLGGGTVLAGAPDSIETKHVVELEPEILRANESLRGLRAYDPLSDDRIGIILNDARNALRLTDRRYDAIVSQPSHPWTAGASHLFTREFLSIVKEHLEPGGVFLQWMGTEFLDAPLLRNLIATLLAEFPHVRLYRPSSRDLLFLASNEALDLESEWIRRRLPAPDQRSHFQRLGIGSAEDLVAALVAGREGLASVSAGAAILTDDRNRMATHSRRGGGLSAREVDALFRAHDPLLDRDGPFQTELRPTLSFPYLVRSLLRMGKRTRAQALLRLLPEGSTRLMSRAELRAEAGDRRQSILAARAARAADPTDPQSTYFLYREQIAGSRSPDSGTVRPHDMQGSARATALGWELARQRRWVDLSKLDGDLARSQITDLWFPDAALLRARWRMLSGGDPKRMAAEALTILDDALLFARDTRPILERLRIALGSGQEELLIESARSVVRIFEHQVGEGPRSADALDSSALARMQSNLNAILSSLSQEFAPKNRHRARLVHEAAAALQARLSRVRPRRVDPDAA